MATIQADKDAGPAPPYSEPDISAAEKVVATPGLSDIEEFLARPFPAAKSVTTPWVGLLLFLLCLLMHIVLVGFHVVLVVFHYRLDGTAFKIPVPSIITANYFTASLFEKVSLLPNIIIKIYLVPLLYLTQLLALRRDLHIEQTLTAMHDKSQAWLSLGATGVTLLKYRDIFRTRRAHRDTWYQDLASLASIVFVFLYLIGGLVLAIIAPDLITAGPVIGNENSFEKLTSALPGIGQDINKTQDAFPVVDLLPVLSTDQDVIISGLSANLIYDIPTFISGSAVPANGTAFTVGCQLIPGGSQAGNFNAVNSTFPIHVHDELMDIDVTPLPRTMNIRSAVWRNASLGTVPPPVLLLSSTLPIIDQTGSSGNLVITLNATLDPRTCILSSDCAPTSTIQLVACNVGVRSLVDSVQVLTESFPYIQADTSFVFNHTESWSDWTLPGAPTDPTLSNIGSLGAISPPSHATQLFQVPGSSRIGNYTLTLLEDNVMEALGYYQTDVMNPNITQLEEVLEQAIAAVFWRAAVRSVGDQSQGGSEKVQYSLQIRHWQPWLGTGISGMMLFIALILTRQPWPKPNRHGPHVNGLGVLELTWLLGRDQTRIARRMAELDNPDPENLRSHGKTLAVSFCD